MSLVQATPPTALPRLLRRSTMERIAAPICDQYGITLDELCAPSGRTGARDSYFVFVRALVARAIRDQGAALTRIGEFLGGRDHSTVWWMLVRPQGGDLRPDELEFLRLMINGLALNGAVPSRRLGDTGLIKTKRKRWLLTERGRRIAMARCRS